MVKPHFSARHDSFKIIILEGRNYMSHEILQLIAGMEGLYLAFVAFPYSLLYAMLTSPNPDGFKLLLEIILLNLVSMLVVAIVVSVMGVIFL